MKQKESHQCFVSFPGHTQNCPGLTNTKNSLAHIKSSLKIIFLNKPITKGRLFFFALFIFRGRTENVSTAKDLYAFSLSLKKEYNISGTFLGKQNSSPIQTICSTAICKLSLSFLPRSPLPCPDLHNRSSWISFLNSVFPNRTFYLKVLHSCSKNLKNGSS